MSNEEQVSLSCKAYCQHKEFQERFKVLKQISGKLSWTIRHWYRYCSTCMIWLRMRSAAACKCCGRMVRHGRDTRKKANRRYYLKHREQIITRVLKNYHEKSKSQGQPSQGISV